MFNEDNPYWSVAKRILELCGESSREMIIALHNNSSGGNFHLDNIKKWSNISVLSRKDPDIRSMIWISGNSPKPDQILSAEIEFYKELDLNVVYEYVPQNQRGDGSLSVYATKKVYLIEILKWYQGKEAIKKVNYKAEKNKQNT